MGMEAMVLSSDTHKVKQETVEKIILELCSRAFNLLLSCLGSQFKTHSIRVDGKLAKTVNPTLKEQKLLSYGETER